MTILNLGCGNWIMEETINHDLHRHRPEVDIVWDLNDFPWPWKDNEFDLIHACAVFEHLDVDLVKCLNECWRLLKPGGVVRLKLPYWNSDVSYQDPTHRWFFSVKSFDQFDPNTRRGSSTPSIHLTNGRYLRLG